ncbi:lytic murein transglycosylase [Spongisporangium articulatum]|uniref:Lytic murein transglycosylase n=1 Tax=Spongisporangium articulatum TaxID=3362603 RepID=A0ABW8ASH8_9ACTN
MARHHHRRAIGVLLAVIVLIVSTAAEATSASADSLRAAQDRASEAAAKVDALLDRYQQAADVEAKQVAVLTQAMTAQEAAEVDSSEAAAQASRARAVQQRRIRAIYADGGPAGLFVSLLAANSPDDLMWRVGTADRIAAGVLADDRTAVQQQADAVALARSRQTLADAAAARQYATFQELQGHTDDAANALAQARATLAALDKHARTLRAARRAAAAVDAAAQAARTARLAAAGPVTALGIPAEYETAYKAAAKTCAGMPWTLLAGVGQIESGHGRNNGPSSAGAIGPMQFMPATFRSYAVDGDGDGTTSAWDPQDAIFTAARYLCASGAKGGSAAGVHKALLAYNHAEWYVDLVLGAQAAIAAKLMR